MSNDDNELEQAGCIPTVIGLFAASLVFVILALIGLIEVARWII
jgi:hypothetical protein